MPAALSIEIRREIVERRQKGETFRAISKELQVSYEGVRGIWRHWNKYGRLDPNYEACAQRGIRYSERVYEHAIEMKKAHQRWGAMVIRIQLCDEFSEAEVPQIRTLQTWFRQAGVNRSPALRQKKS